MRIVVHDYSGHPFQVELSRALAARGHEVLHLYCESFLTPHGALSKRPDDPATFQVEPIVLAKSVDKVNVFKRRKADMEHGIRVCERLATYKPDMILSANAPLDAQKKILEFARRNKIGFVFWVQDLFGQAIKRLMTAKYLGLGNVAGSHYISLENRMLVQSTKVVLIAQDFRPYLPEAIKNDPKVYVVENWAPLGDLPTKDRINAWGTRHGFAVGLNYLYSGTLGMKHNPELLIQLANKIRGRGRLIVVSEGKSVEFLKNRGAELGLDNLHVLPFQPFSDVPEMLATADVLVAILAPDAGVFAVPSKVLTYLCSGKSLLLAVPAQNLAAQIVLRAGAGLVSDPTDENAFIANALTLLEDADLRAKLGKGGREYAEKTFDIDTIADRFEGLLTR